MALEGTLRSLAEGIRLVEDTVECLELTIAVVRSSRVFALSHISTLEMGVELQ